MNIEILKKILKEEYKKIRGAYKKGVILYALELADNIGDHYIITQEQRENLEKVSRHDLEAFALNGASSWRQYSWGGCSLCYNYDILERLYCPSMVKRYENSDTVQGFHLLDRQAHALARAFGHIFYIIKRWAQNYD